MLRKRVSTLLSMLIDCLSLVILACPEPEKPSTDTANNAQGNTNTPSFTLTFDVDGDTGNMPALSVPKGSTATKPTYPPENVDPVPSTITPTFGGWYQDKDRTTPFFFATNAITQDITLYAGWNTLNHYTVRFNSNGDSGIPPQTIVKGHTATKPTFDPTRNGYTFVNWYTDLELTTPLTLLPIRLPSTPPSMHTGN